MSNLTREAASAGARYKLNSSGEEFLEPLLGITELDSDDSSEEEENVEDGGNGDIQKQGPWTKLKTIAGKEPKSNTFKGEYDLWVNVRLSFCILHSSQVYCILGAGVGFFALAFVFAPQTLVFIAGSICIANLNNLLRVDALRLEQEVDVLSAEIDVLTPEADRARVVEGELQEIADQQHCNVDKLVELVKENQDIIDAMKENLRKRVIQDIVKIVVDCDKDNDMRINKVEAKMLALKIRIQLQEYGVDFDEARFYKVLSVNPSVPRIISIVQKLCPHYVQHMAIQQDEPSTDDAEDDTEVVNEDEAEELKQVYDMFTWQSDEDTGLSAGRRESLMAPTKWESKRNINRTRFSDPSGRRTIVSGDLRGNTPTHFSK
ncbi:hypothetical protein HJC23_013817 [Cyclotella cryptica]|uniref:EF-hand domain-containing protein n=1 Tax=Cyclotella cryptica TaxID=29204 RepID=A0ABD3P1A9_9STRA